jgi:hypothetical protein
MSLDFLQLVDDMLNFSTRRPLMTRLEALGEDQHVLLAGLIVGDARKVAGTLAKYARPHQGLTPSQCV